MIERWWWRWKKWASYGSIPKEVLAVLADRFDMEPERKRKKSRQFLGLGLPQLSG